MFTPRDRDGAQPLTDEEIQAKFLSLKLPDSPRTPISLVPTESGEVIDLNSSNASQTSEFWGSQILRYVPA